MEDTSAATGLLAQIQAREDDESIAHQFPEVGSDVKFWKVQR